MIEAAGGVVWRREPDGTLAVLVVHRPRYDDWSLPKGKLDPGETHLEAALREVEEEAGLVCEAGAEVDEVRYVDHNGRDKRVRYWTMQVVSGAFAPNDEVDEVRWVELDELGPLLTYAHVAELVAGLPPLLD